MIATAKKIEREANHRVAPEKMIQLVTFRVANVLLGIDIAHVQEINRSLEVTPVPESSSAIHGVVNLRGDVVTVLNPHFILELTPTDNNEKGRNLILNMNGERIGVLVDSICDIVTLPVSDLSPRPSNVRQIDRRFVESVYLRETDLILILNPVGLFAAVCP